MIERGMLRVGCKSIYCSLSLSLLLFGSNSFGWFGAITHTHSYRAIAVAKCHCQILESFPVHMFMKNANIAKNMQSICRTCCVCAMHFITFSCCCAFSFTISYFKIICMHNNQRDIRFDRDIFQSVIDGAIADA